ncbi:MAG: hypothetical protein HRU31_07485 [Rhodobacteraceae bacterium]|nr:hypothetical protein [Paracoccaceae bacterium]
MTDIRIGVESALPEKPLNSGAQGETDLPTASVVVLDTAENALRAQSEYIT